MKTVHVHHDGQYWRGFRHGFVGLAITLAIVGFLAANQQSARSESAATNCPAGTVFRGVQGDMKLCEAMPMNLDKAILPMPAWWMQYPDAHRLSGAALREMDRHGLRPVEAAKAEKCG